MIKTIFFWMLGLLLVTFVAVWLWTGGISKAKDASKVPTNLVDMIFFRGGSTGNSFKLPWQPAQLSNLSAQDPYKDNLSPDAGLYGTAQGAPAGLYDDTSSGQ